MTLREKQSEAQGYLSKYGENFASTGWRKRWFVLKKDKLKYYKSVHDSHAAGIIPLNDANLSNVNEQALTFEIDTPYRIYLLKAHTLNDFKNWTNYLQLAYVTESATRRHTQAPKFLLQLGSKSAKTTAPVKSRNSLLIKKRQSVTHDVTPPLSPTSQDSDRIVGKRASPINRVMSIIHKPTEESDKLGLRDKRSTTIHRSCSVDTNLFVRTGEDHTPKEIQIGTIWNVKPKGKSRLSNNVEASTIAEEVHPPESPNMENSCKITTPTIMRKKTA